MASGKDEAEQNAAWDFMKYLQAPEVQAKWHVGTGYFAINPAAYEEQVVKDAYEKMPQLQLAVQQLQATKPSYCYTRCINGYDSGVRKIMESALEQLFITVEMLMKHLIDAVRTSECSD